MTTSQQRHNAVVLISEAVASGARQAEACKVIGISERTLQRWRPTGKEQLKADRRPTAHRPLPGNQLTRGERQQVLDICNQPEFASLSPSQIVPKLADQGMYLASESTMYRILKAEGQLNTRGRARKRRASCAPRTHLAHAPNQVWTWDITFLQQSEDNSTICTW